MMATEIENLVLRISADAKALKKQLGEAEKEVEGFAAKVGAKMKSVGSAMTGIGKSMSLYVTAPIVAGTTASVAAFASFDDAMTQSTAIITDWGNATRQQMEETAIALSTQGPQSARDLAESYFFLASAGLSVEQQIAALPAVQKFATAGMFDMALATDLLTDAQSALKMTSADAAENLEGMIELSDMLVRANQLANASVEQFSTALTSKAGAALAAFEIPAEQGVAVLAAMADQGIKAELAGNGLDRMLRLLSKSAIENKAAHKALGFEVFDAQGNMNDMANVVFQLEKITEGMSAEVKAATLDMLGFDARVQGIILPLLGTSEAIAGYTSELEDAGGTTQQVSNNQMQSFNNQMKALWDDIKNVAREIGQKLIPIVQAMADKVKASIEWWRGLSDGAQNTILAIAGVAAAIGPLLIVVGSLIGFLGTLSIIWSKNIIQMVASKGVTLALAAAKGVLTIATKALGFALKAVPFVLVAAGVVYLAKKIFDLAANTAEYNRQAERRNKLDKQLADMRSKKFEKEIESFGELEDVEKVEELRKAISKSTREVEGYRFQVSASKKNLQEMGVDLDDVVDTNNRLHALGLKDLKSAEDRLDAQIEHQRELKEMLRLEEEKLKKAEAAAAIEEKRKAEEGGVARAIFAEEIKNLNEMNKKLKEQEETYGMTASEIEIYRAQVKGASDAQLEELRVIQEENDAIEENLKMREEEKEKAEEREAYFKDTIEALNEEIATFGMSTAELAKYKAEKEGLSEIEVGIIGIQAKTLEKMKEEQKLMEKGKQLTESLMSEEEKFAKGKEELDKMLKMGAIDLETYTKAMEKLKKDTTIKVKFKVSGVDAVAAGSAEAAAKLEEFRALHGGGEKVDFRAQGKEILDNQNKAFQAGPKAGNGADAKEKEDLSNIEMNTRIMAERIPVIVEEAGLV
jgi:TP901 family phage tail tape measure protein